LTVQPVQASPLAPLAELRFESAAEHLTTRVPRVAPVDTAGAVREALVGRRFDAVAEIVVCEGERLVGLVNIEDVLAAPAGALLSDLMDAKPPVVSPGVDQEVAAWTAVRHGESSLAVVDERGRFLGLIPPRRLLEVLLSEHEEDMARVVGVLVTGTEARLAAEEAVMRRLWHRIPWLLIGLVGAILSADLVSLFHAQLEKHVILAFFVPGIVYLADAVGTQTETLVIRGLSVGIPIARTVRRELITGALIGLALAAISLPVIWVHWGRQDVALTVAIALVGACSTATLVAMALPWLLARLGLDPAFGSGPVATVVQDLLSVAVYFSIAVVLVH
jgi:magnesium transporter